VYKLCKTEQSSARQYALEQRLLALMEQKRYEDISVSELCSSIQIPRKAFYRYFSGKDGALFALLDHTMMEFHMTGVSAITRNAREELDRFFRFWHSRKHFLDLLDKSNLSGLLVERAMIIAMQERMMPRRMLALDTATQKIALSFAVCGIMSMVIRWHRDGFQETPDEITGLAVELLSKPLLPL